MDSETYQYDPVGHMTQAQNSSATTVITYDDAGRLKQVTQGTALTTNTYDQNGFLGKLTTRVDPAGTMTYAYDANGRLQTLGSPFSGVASATYGHDDAGREVARTDPAGVSTTRHYDTAGRADSENVTKGSSIASFAYTFDPVGNVSRIVQTVSSNPDSGTWDFTYDDQNRLQTAAKGGVTTTYAYDGAGKVEEIWSAPLTSLMRPARCPG